MQKRKKFIPHIVISVLSLVGLALLINTFDPKTLFDISIIKLPILIPFFFLIFLTTGGLFIFILSNIRRGIIIGIFAASFLLLQYLHSNNIFYTALLVLIVILIDILFWKKK